MDQAYALPHPLTPRLPTLFPDVPPLAVLIHDTLVAAGFPYSPPHQEGWPHPGFLLDFRTAHLIIVTHWNARWSAWADTDLDQRTLYREALYAYWRALANADRNLLICEGALPGSGVPTLEVRVRVTEVTS